VDFWGDVGRVRSNGKGDEYWDWLWRLIYSRAVWWRSVDSQCEGGMAPSASMHGRESDCCDWMRTMVREVAAHEVHGMWHVNEGLMVMV
jgi:hypothetical protein